MSNSPRFDSSRNKNSGKGGDPLSKAGIFIALAAAAFFGFQKMGCAKEDISKPQTETQAENRNNGANAGSEPQDDTWFPRNGKGQIVQHDHFTLSYREDHEQAEWVAHELFRKQLNVQSVEREDNFRPDPLVSTKSATPDDYRGSGYDRGHLCPAGDRGFSYEASQETFFMSNMSPQSGPFNKGIWRELEENVRDWARDYKHLYVVTGPVLTKRPEGYIGKQNKVSVPVSYYKVMLDVEGRKAIGFVIMNEVSEIPLVDFAVSIDEVERITGLDFFKGLLSPEEEDKIERKADANLWPLDQQRYKQRVEKWNHQ